MTLDATEDIATSATEFAAVLEFTLEGTRMALASKRTCDEFR
jgi:hypothetical protein